VAYKIANDDESFNTEMESDSLESPNKKIGVVFLASGAVKVCGLHIG
jgi:hypothetical protein